MGDSEIVFLHSYSKLTQEERFTYEQQLKHERDWNACLRTAERDGVALGLEKGRIEERTVIAQKLKSLGIDIEVIMQSTGLTEEEIEAM